jgi:catechol 2,3-dioxygenase-like lactoylglutathione lyase family enzyme
MATQIKEKPAAKGKFDVGGVVLDRPFRIRRLGHFGFNVTDFDACMRFYVDLLGFSISDPIDFGARIKDPAERAKLGQTVGYFMRHGTDHHSFVVFPRRTLDAMRGVAPGADEVNVNQITWQVGSLREVVEATKWFTAEKVPFRRTGRDTPGSNWHVYPLDPDHHTNELYYGIEQIGWEGYSKPQAMYTRGFSETPSLPQMSEFDEVEEAKARGVDLESGYRYKVTGEAKYDVGGILLPRPFKVVRIGPVRLFVRDIEAALGFYRERLGLAVTEEVHWKGHRCVFLRCNTEHHSVALYPMALRSDLGAWFKSSCLAFGLQVAEYGQLKDAVAFLEDRGVEIKYLPPELCPGIDYSAFAIDPDGQAIQLYYYMEQVGWDGKPRPPELRRKVEHGKWPDRLEPVSDTYAGEPYLGPWA